MKANPVLTAAAAALLFSVVPSWSSDPWEGQIRSLESEIRGLQDQVRSLSEKVSRVEYAARDTSHAPTSESHERSQDEKISRNEYALRDVKDAMSRMQSTIAQLERKNSTFERRTIGTGSSRILSTNGGVPGSEYTACSTNEVVTQVYWKERAIRCASLIEQ